MLTGAFYFVLTAAALLVGALFGPAGMQVAIQILAMLGGAWATALVIDAVAAFQEPTADRTLTGRFRAILPYLTTLSIVTVLSSVLVGLGLILIVPGLVFLTWWALVLPVVVLERTGIRECFRGAGSSCAVRG